MMNFPTAALPVKVTTSRFDSASTAPLHPRSFGLGVCPSDWDELAAEHRAMDVYENGLALHEVSGEGLRSMAPPGPIAAASPDVFVTTYDAEAVGRFNTLIYDWSMAHWPEDDGDKAAWGDFQVARLAEEVRLRESLWPQTAPAFAQSAVQAEPTSEPPTRPKRRELGVGQVASEEARSDSRLADLARVGTSAEADGDDWHALEGRRRCLQLVTA
jgi:hypothetical protein